MDLKEQWSCQLQAVEVELKSANRQLTSSRTQARQLADGKAALLTEIADLEAKITTFKDLSRASSRKVRILEADVCEKSKELAAAHEKLDELVLQKTLENEKSGQVAAEQRDLAKATNLKNEQLVEANKKLLELVEEHSRNAQNVTETQEYHNLSNRAAQIDKELSAVKKYLEQRNRKCILLESQVQTLAGEKAKLAEELAILSEQMSKAKATDKSFRQVNKKVADLENQLAVRGDTANAQLASSKATISETKAELEHTKELLEKTKKGSEKISESAAVTEAALTDNRSQLSAATEKLDAAKRELADTKEQLVKISSSSTENEKVQELLRQLEASKAQFREVTDALKTQKQDAESALQEQRRQTERILQGQKQEMAGVTGAARSVHDKVSNMEQQLEAAKLQHAEALAAKDAQIAAMHKEGRDILVSLQAKETECTAIRADHDKLATELAKSQQACLEATREKEQSLRDRDENDNVMIEQLTKDVQQAYTERYEFESQLFSLQTEREQAVAEIESSKQLVADLNVKLDHMEQNNKVASEELREQNDQNRSLSKQCDDFESFNKTLAELNDTLSNELAATQAMVAQNDETVQSLQAELVGVQTGDAATIIAGKDATIACLKTELTNIQSLLHSYMAEDQARQQQSGEQPQPPYLPTQPAMPAIPSIDPILTQASDDNFLQDFSGFWAPTAANNPAGGAENIAGGVQLLEDLDEDAIARLLSETLDAMPEPTQQLPGPEAAVVASSEYPDPNLAEGHSAGPPTFNPITGAVNFDPADLDLGLSLDPALSSTVPSSSTPQQPALETTDSALEEEDGSRKRKDRED